jgi:GT2 family glycosyltransferase
MTERHALGGPASDAVAQSSSLTVALCTRNRTAQLARALKSLGDQTVEPDEILVIDNDPADASTHRMMLEIFPRVRYFLEMIPGLDFARNRAWREAGTDVLAFLDDDVVASRSWCESILRVFVDDAKAGACTGRVEALVLETEAQRLFEANGGFSGGDHRISLPADAGRRLRGLPAPLIAWTVSVGSGCSMAFRKTALDAIGGFDPALDLGAALPGGGDHDAFWRVLQGGFSLVYEPRALAWHEHRRELGSVHDQLVGHQLALITFLTKALKNATGSQRLGVLAFLLWRLAKPGVRLARRLLGRDPLPSRVLLRMWRSCARGLFEYRRSSEIAAARRCLSGGEAKEVQASLSTSLFD